MRNVNDVWRYRSLVAPFSLILFASTIKLVTEQLIVKRVLIETRLLIVESST